MLERIELIEKHHEGHHYYWLFHASDGFEMEKLIESQCCEPHPGFEQMGMAITLEAMREARQAGTDHLMKGAMR